MSFASDFIQQWTQIVFSLCFSFHMIVEVFLVAFLIHYQFQVQVNFNCLVASLRTPSGVPQWFSMSIH